MKPSLNASMVFHAFTGPFGDQDLGSLVAVMSDNIERAQNGDMKTVESMLYGHAFALQSIFVGMSVKSSRAEYVQRRDRPAARH